MMTEQRRDQDLLSWQFSLYPRGHRDRRNLLLHVLTVPLFMAGTVALACAWRWPWLFALGPVAMLVAMALQGRGHQHEPERPVPFAGPLDVVARIFVEQWVTFPRFVASGGFARAWRGGDGA
jgi:hypothetical protein